MSEVIRAGLEGYYVQLDSDVRITDLTPISGGWETEVYSFTRTRGGRSESLILRMYPGSDAAEKSIREFRAIARLRDLGHYPVPRVYHLENTAGMLGKPFIIMQKIDGRSMGALMLEDSARQPELLTRFVQLFVDLHRVDYHPFEEIAGVSPNPMYFLVDMLERWHRIVLSDLKQTWAAPVLDWLTTHVRELSPQISVIHADFHPYNVLITPDDELYVIDWSGISVGDYRSDLAWTLLLVSTSGYPELREIILSEYARLAGKPVEQIEFFDVVASLRRLVDFSVSLGSGAEAMGMRPETVAIMRERGDHYRQVYALLQDRTGLHLPEIEQLLNSLSQ